MRPAHFAVAVGFIALMTSSCAPGPLSSTWLAPGAVPSQYRDILVLGVATNPRVRRAYEDHFVSALGEIGVKATASHTLIPDERLRSAKAVQEAVGRSGADGVVVTYLAAEDTDPSSTGTRTHVLPSLYERLYPYYGHVLGKVTTAGYYADYRALRLETNLYDAARATLVWSGRSEPLDPSSEETMISEVIAAVIGKLKAEGLLPA